MFRFFPYLIFYLLCWCFLLLLLQARFVIGLRKNFTIVTESAPKISYGLFISIDEDSSRSHNENIYFVLTIDFFSLIMLALLPFTHSFFFFEYSLYRVEWNVALIECMLLISLCGIGLRVRLFFRRLYKSLFIFYGPLKQFARCYYWEWVIYWIYCCIFWNILYLSFLPVCFLHVPYHQSFVPWRMLVWLQLLSPI